MSESEASAQNEPRSFCYRCHKATRTCVCDSIQRVDNRTPVVVVQHPRERHHPIGTVRFAHLGLTRCEVAVAEGQPDKSVRARYELPPNAALLYPGEGARELDRLAPDHHPAALVVLDGTWSTVRKLLAGDPRLRELPRVCVTPAIEQRYRIRREPRAECMSTLGAMVAALEVLEPELGPQWEALLGAFDRMVDQQLEIVSRHGRPRFRQPGAPQQFRAVPASLGLERGPVVVVDVETTQVNRIGEPGTRRRRQVVRLSALRLHPSAPSERFDALVHIEGQLPKPKQLAFMGIEAEELLRGYSLRELEAHWQNFVRPDDRLAAWNQLSLDLLPGSHSGERFVLKGIYASLRRRRAGDLEGACEREGLEFDPSPARGLRRVRAAAAMTRWLAGQRSAG